MDIRTPFLDIQIFWQNFKQIPDLNFCEVGTQVIPEYFLETFTELLMYFHLNSLYLFVINKYKSLTKAYVLTVF